MAETKRNLYGLLVGINKYEGNVRRLRGCVNDVNKVHSYLAEKEQSFQLKLQTLTNEQATYQNIIDTFLNHLCQAGPEDVVLYYHSGHGSREKAAPEFKTYFPDGFDETLVCYDSRAEKGLDLADKELAILLSKVAQKTPHIVVIIDSCHSESMTREPNDFNLMLPRFTSERDTPRPLKSYFDGYYQNKLEKEGKHSIPKSKHILLSACERTQRAWESSFEPHGIFTKSLLEVLKKSKDSLSYADLFTRCRFRIRESAYDQTPQLQAYEGFNAYSQFLNGKPLEGAPKYDVFYEEGQWKIACGAIHGLPTDPEKPIEFEFYSKETNQVLGTGKSSFVGAQTSTLELQQPLAKGSFEDEAEDLSVENKTEQGEAKGGRKVESSKIKGAPSQHYKASITNLPILPLVVYLEGNSEEKKVLQERAKTSLEIAFSEENKEAKYTLKVQNQQLLLFSETGFLIHGVEGNAEDSLDYILSILSRIAQWERSVILDNENTAFNREKVRFQLSLLEQNNETDVKIAPEIKLDFQKKNDEWQRLYPRLKASNNTGQQLYFTLLYFSKEYGIHQFYSEPLESSPKENDTFVTLFGDGEEDYLYLPEGVQESTDIFKLVITTKPLDHFLLTQEDLELGKIVSLRGPKDLSSAKPEEGRKIQEDWFTKTINVKVIRQLNQISKQSISLANRQITIKEHPSFKANVSLTSAYSQTKSLDRAKRIPEVFQGFELLDFAEGTRGKEENILELDNIQNKESLKETPLEIIIHKELKEEEMLFPFTFDGEHFLPVGETSYEAGKITVKMSYIPAVDEGSRSLSNALKLCFLKLLGKRNNLNQLRWVDYPEDGSSPNRYENKISEKVEKANKILLMIHGIIGNTEEMAKCPKRIFMEEDKNLTEKYDLVLTYDYENLNTSIQDNARTFKTQLAGIGLNANHGKELTILAHSMGGLVSRWFIEKEGGDKVVNRLVMAGTPNNGSILGEFPSYRTHLMSLFVISLNFFKPGLPFIAGLLFTLNNSKKLTVALEEMKAGSQFLKDLNSSADPHIPYSILAGDITHYEIDEKRFFARLLEKIELGVGKLIYEEPNDIAVATKSIQAVDNSRKPASEKHTLICHHLNYFESEAGLEALSKIL